MSGFVGLYGMRETIRTAHLLNTVDDSDKMAILVSTKEHIYLSVEGSKLKDLTDNDPQMELSKRELIRGSKIEDNAE